MSPRAGKVLTTSASTTSASSRGAAAAPAGDRVGARACRRSAANGPMWRSARISPPARCTAAIAPRSPLREALILQAALNHPWLSARPHGGTGRGRVPPRRHAKAQSALIDAFAHHVARISARIPRPRAPPAAPRCWPSSTAAALPACSGASSAPSPPPQCGACGRRPLRRTFLLTWKQLVALHRQWHSLTRELKDAELALGQDNSEANYTRLVDVKARLSTLDGTEGPDRKASAPPRGGPTRSL